MRSSQPVVNKRFILSAQLVCAVLLVIAGFTAGGQRGGIGVTLGLVGTAVSLFGTWAAVQWTGKVMRESSPKWHAAAVPIAFMVIKLPVILGAMSWALRLGPPAPSWFLAGLALVYSGLVWWAVATT